jgi:hypothetical protein
MTSSRRKLLLLLALPLLLCGLLTLFAYLPAEDDAPIPFDRQGGASGR